MKIKLFLLVFICFSDISATIYYGKISISDKYNPPIVQKARWSCFSVVPNYIKNIDKDLKEVIAVEIKLNTLFSSTGKLITKDYSIYLPINVFQNQYENFKKRNETIYLQVNTENDDSCEYCLPSDFWNLTLDESFDKIEEYYTEFKERKEDCVIQ